MSDRFKKITLDESEWNLERWLEESIPPGWIIIKWTTDSEYDYRHTIVIRNGIDG